MLSVVAESFLRQILSKYAGPAIESFHAHPVGGGSINQAYQLVLNRHTRFFCKINSATQFPGLFEKEKNGLQLLSSRSVIKTPLVIATEILDDQQVLVLEWIEQGLKTGQFWQSFGEQLAQLHHVSATSFGLADNNYMGALPQANAASASWTDFFMHQRLQPQVRLAAEHGLLQPVHIAQIEKLYPALPGIFAPEPPSLLHGDLWSGNFLCNEKEQPVLVDPAVYFGHRSMDLGMTTLFGGFDPRFYEACHYHFPFPPNYREQWDICNLYPLLIHLNLFGKSYLADILHTVKRF